MSARNCLDSACRRLQIRDPRLYSIDFPPLLKKFWLWISILSALSIAYTLLMTFAFKLRFPYGLPWIEGSAYSDFTVFQERFVQFRTPSFWSMASYPVTYPAPLDVVFALLYKLPHPLAIYFALTLSAVAGGACLLVRGLTRKGVRRSLAIGFAISALVTSFPLAYLLDRGNIEGVVMIVLAAGVIAVLQNRCMLGATLIGIAGAMKFFPLVLLALLLSKRRYREFAGGLVVTGLVTLASLKILGPDIVTAQRGISAGLQFFNGYFATQLLKQAVGFDHSLFALIKMIAVAAHYDRTHHEVLKQTAAGQLSLIEDQRHFLGICLKVYLAIAATFGVLVYFLRIRRLPMLNQVILLTICAVVLPQVSFDYTLIHLFLPFGLLCIYVADAWQKGLQVRGLTLSLACLSVVFTLGSYFTVAVRLAAQARAVALIVMFIAVCRYPFPWKELDTGPSETL